MISEDNDLAYLGYQQVQRSEKAKRVRSFFSKVADKYDLMNTVLSFGIHHQWKRTAIRFMKLEPGDHILDLCGGTGDLAILSAKSVGPSGKVVLCDMNRDMIAAGLTQKKHQTLRKQVLYIQGDAENLPFQNDSFQGVTVGFGVRNLTSIQNGLKEILRVLTPGGKLMCLEFSQPLNTFFRFLYDIYSFHLMPYLGALVADSSEAYTYLSESIRMFPTPEKLKAIMEETGFTDVIYHRLTNGIAAVHIGKKCLASA